MSRTREPGHLLQDSLKKKKGVQVVRRGRGWPRGGGGRSGKNMRKNGREND